MDNELCFIIDSNKLYLEQILVEYNDVPIYFICKDSKEYYISLCSDIEELCYFVVKVSELDIYNLLHGNLTMRDSIIKQSYYWEIVSADEMENDRVELKCIDDLDLSVLPEEGAYFSILTEEISKYVTEFDTRFLENRRFTLTK